MTTTLHEEPTDPEAADAPAEAIAVHALGLHDGATRRLSEAGAIRFVDTPTDAGLAVVSTRIPRRRSVSAVLEELTGGRTDLPVFVLAHPGGEGLAVEFLRAGARAVVAEGNESRLVGPVTAGSDREELVETFERRLERHGAGSRPGTAIGRSPFESRVHELAQAGSTPRIALARIQEWDRATARLSPEALELLDRRLTVQFADMCQASDAEMHRVRSGEYGIISRDLSASRADTLGRNLEAVAASFSPGRTSSLRLSLGHVGPEVTSDPTTLLELSRRALELADSNEGSNVVNADDMSRALASSTELDTAFRARSFLERHDPSGGSHGDRVADLVTTLAEHLGLEGRDLTKLRLAAQLHDLGKVSLPDEDAYLAHGTQPGLAYRSHPERGGEALGAAGADVVTAVRHHHERWDGTGFPDGLAADAIPIGARLIALADAVDRATHPDGSMEEALRAVEAEAGSAFDPELVRLAVQVLTS